MGFALEQKLIIKHTFLEYVFEQNSDIKPARQRSQTEPVIDSRLSYGDVRELLHGSSSGSSLSNSVDTADEVEPSCHDMKPAEPSMPDAHAVVAKACLPQSTRAEYTLESQHSTWQCVNGYYWIPMPSDVKMGMHSMCIASNPSQLHGPHTVQDLKKAAPWNVAKNMSSIASAPVTEETQTTVMLKGLPESLTRSTMMQLLNAEGFCGSFNFLYVPIDFKKCKNLGYAIVNLASPTEALRFCKHFEGYSSWNVASNIICTVAWCSPQQGVEAQVERYRNSPVMHESVPAEWRPLMLAHGRPIAFPAPTMKIKAPKLKSGR